MPLGASWGHLGPLEAIFGVFDRSWTVWDHIELSGRRLGALLERSWGRLRGPLGPSWTRLGLSWGPLGLSWDPIGGFLGRLGAALGSSWAV